MNIPEELIAPTLGPCRFRSPRERLGADFIPDGDRVLLSSRVGNDGRSFERAGPRARVYFDPVRTTAAIVTCGGLSPGLNNVIRSATLELIYNYGVARVLGIKNGYMGLDPATGEDPVVLDRDFVRNIHELGGTVLGSSRGPHDPDAMAARLDDLGVDILLCVGGDGTQRGAAAVREAVARRGREIAVVGVPKTIDNDIPYVWMSFGHATALEEARKALCSAHTEALGAPNGIGLVKLMGRDAGFIAAGAAVASQDANFVLVPEIAFPLHGSGGFLDALEQRMRARGHALVVVAEGAGQHLFDDLPRERDPSGNPRFRDIGAFLRDAVRAHFAAVGLPVNLKYIDPSYLIRSVPASTWDCMLADRMARCAVHAAFAGRTGVMVGWWNQEMVHVPLALVAGHKQRLAPDGELWRAVLSATGQPRWTGP